MSMAQLELMVGFIEENPDLVSGKLTNLFSKEKKINKWTELTNILNCSGSGATKDADKWKKVLYSCLKLICIPL